MVDGSTSPDGAVVISFPGACDGVYAIGLRRVLVQVIRHRRPVCLILDLAEVRELDPIILGTLAAACCLGDDHGVGVFLDNSPAGFADLLAAAGVPRCRLRHVR